MTIDGARQKSTYLRDRPIAVAVPVGIFGVESSILSVMITPEIVPELVCVCELIEAVGCCHGVPQRRLVAVGPPDTSRAGVKSSDRRTEE